MHEVAREIDAMITAAGMLNCHQKHIGRVLGHRISYCNKTWWVKRRLWGGAATGGLLRGEQHSLAARQSRVDAELECKPAMRCAAASGYLGGHE